MPPSPSCRTIWYLPRRVPGGSPADGASDSSAPAAGSPSVARRPVPEGEGLPPGPGVRRPNSSLGSLIALGTATLAQVRWPRGSRGLRRPVEWPWAHVAQLATRAGPPAPDVVEQRLGLI